MIERYNPMKATAFLVACLAPCSATAVDPVVTELMADNRDTIGLPEVNGPDWIEIHNPGGSAIDLAGWHLTDNAQDLDQWTFPAGATIASGGYLIVYASGLDMIGGGGEYHTNFGLSDQGEYLALVQPGGSVAQEFAPSYPQQYPDISYGLTSGGTNAYFTSPTPGSPNNTSVQGFVQDTTFSHDRGFYDASFELQVTTATSGATIYYTTDGSTPDETSSFVDAPDPASLPILTLTIPTTTIVRAYAVKTGYESTNVDTQTYVFPDHVLTRRNLSSSITQHATWGPLMRDALLEIPSISLVTQEDIPNTNPTNPSDIYLDPAEVHVSIEMMFPDGRDGFQHNAAIERFGGQYTVFDKQALRVSFKSELNGDPADPIDGPKRLKFDLFGETPYGGDTAVKSFDQIILRNGSHDSIFSTHYSHSRGNYTRARYFSDRQIEMGHLSMRGRFVHVYLNGVYNGQYHLMERPNADFMATHQGGEEADYDIMKGRSGIKAMGDAQAQTNAWSTWNTLKNNLDNYSTVQANMDVDSYIDYMLLNFYGGNKHDWYPSHNWVAGRKHVGGKYQFFMWDNDFLNRRGGNSTTASTANVTGHGGPGNMWNSLKNHLEFRIRVADRAQKHFFNGGMLSPERVAADFTELGERISRTVIPEIARWTDVAPGSYDPDTFQASINWITDVNGPDRTDTVITQMQADGSFPTLDAPGISPFGGSIVSGQAVAVTKPAGGTLYYTVDGVDPRLIGGSISGSALSSSAGAVTLPNGAGVIMARVKSGSTWSPLVEAEFMVGNLAGPGDLMITELNYRPAAPTPAEIAAGFDSRTDFEFLEIMNISGVTLQLADLVMTSGFNFEFAGRSKTNLAPGERGLLVYSQAAFLFRYPEGASSIIGEYAPDKLSNDGEAILLGNTSGTTISYFTYNDVAPWPTAADGDGYSLVLKDPESNPSPTDPLNWRRSYEAGGTLGTGEPANPFSDWMIEQGATDPLAQYASSTVQLLLAYGIGADLVSSPEAGFPSVTMVEVEGIDYPALSYRVRQDAGALTWTVEVSEDCETWQSGETATATVGTPQDNGDGTFTYTVRSLLPGADRSGQFLRLGVALAP